MVDHKLFNSVGSVVIFSIWLLIAIIAIREYIRLMKTPGLPSGMNRREISSIKDPSVLTALSRWKRIVIILFVCWVMSVAIYMTVFIIIDRTVGFND